MDPVFVQVRRLVAWAVIVVCTGALFVLQAVGMQEMKSMVRDDPRPGFNALYLARYAVGIDQMVSGWGQQVMPEFAALIAESAHPLEDQTRQAILAVEVAPPAQATTHHDTLRTALDERRASGASDDAIADAELVLRIYEQRYTPTAAERDGLVDRHGWFGEVAATYNNPASDPARKAPRRSAMHMVVGLLSLYGTAILAAIVGFVLLVVMTVLLSIGKMRTALPTGPASHPTAYLEAAAVFLVLFIGLQLVLGIVQYLTGINLMLVMLLLVPAALLWPMVVGVRWPDFRRDMGMHRGRGFFREVGAGLAGYVAGLPVIAVGMGITIVITMMTDASPDHPMQYEVMEGGVWVLVLMVGSAVVWAPLVEESVFRAAFYRHLRQVRGVSGWLLATVVSSFVFAAIHPQGFAGIPALMSIAFVLAGLREWRGSLIPCITAHAVHNTMVTLMLLIVLGGVGHG
jgi:membrane protease YdiL (CAAX protease family)